MSLTELLGSDLSSADDDEESFAASPTDQESRHEEAESEPMQVSMAQDVEKGERSESLTAKDLFGESASSSESEPEKADPPTAGAGAAGVAPPPSESEDVFRDFDDEEPEEPVRPPSPTRINIDMPRLDARLPPEFYFVKLPNFLSVEPRPFDSTTYLDEVDDDEMLDEEGRTRLKLKVENTIRWRSVKDENGDEVKESNARFVRWSDGSMSLLLGNEVFDIHKQQLMNNDHSHLYLRHGSGLMAQAIFKHKLTFRPHSTDSVTHRKMTLSMADKFSKAQKIRVLPVIGDDPEKRRNEMARQAEVTMKNTMKLENRKKRLREKAASRGLSSRLLEPDQDDEDVESSPVKTFQRRSEPLKQSREEEMADFLASDEEEDDDGGGLSEDEELAQMERLRKAKEDDSIEGGRRLESPRKLGKKRKPVSKRIIESDDEGAED